VRRFISNRQQTSHFRVYDGLHQSIKSTSNCCRSYTGYLFEIKPLNNIFTEIYCDIMVVSAKQALTAKFVSKRQQTSHFLCVWRSSSNYQEHNELLSMTHTQGFTLLLSGMCDNDFIIHTMSYSLQTARHTCLKSLFHSHQDIPVYFSETVFQDFNFKQITGTNTMVGFTLFLSWVCVTVIHPHNVHCKGRDTRLKSLYHSHQDTVHLSENCFSRF
jgi:hypothetical protein